MSKYYLWIFFLCLSASVFGQRKKADNYYNQLQYAAAIPYYNKEATKTTDQEILTRLADCYFKTNDMFMAEYWYRNAIKLGAFKTAEHYMQYGKALKCNEKYEEAKEIFKTYVDLMPDDKLGKMLYYSCDVIQNWPKDSMNYQLGKVSFLNSEASDFCPVFYKDGLVFTSSRITNFLDPSVSGWTGKSFQDIFYAEVSRESNKFYDSKPFSEVINSQLHDGPASFTDNNKTIYFTRVSEAFENNAKADKRMISRLKMYSSEYDNGKWSKPLAFKYNSDSYSVGHPSLSKDGKRLFFASDMPGGFGGTDIYYCDLVDGSWIEPVNAGRGVNTSGNEKFPFIHQSGELYFSSDGRTGYGGLDIFISEEKNGEYAQATNMRFPINSSMDDFGIVLDDEKSSGYISSNRKGGEGEDDIYFIWKNAAQDTLILSKLMEVLSDSTDYENIQTDDELTIASEEQTNDTLKTADVIAKNTALVEAKEVKSVSDTVQKSNNDSLKFTFKSTTYVPEESTKEIKIEPVKNENTDLKAETAKDEVIVQNLATLNKEEAKEEMKLPVFKDAETSEADKKKTPELKISETTDNSERFFTVQIGRYANKHSLDSFPDVESTNIEFSYENGHYVYRTGKFSNYQQAKTRSLELKNKIPGAFVSAYINGQKVSLDKMIQTKKTMLNEPKPEQVEIPKVQESEVKTDKTETNTINSNELPECYLSIQLGKFSKEKDPSLFKNISGLILVKSDNFYIYSIGKYKDYSEAARQSDYIKTQGFPDAFIIGRIHEKNVKIEEFVKAYTSGKCICNTKP